MNGPEALIREVAEWLESLGIPYHVGGSVASSLIGTYRATADADFVVDASLAQLERLRLLLSDDYYVSETALRDAANDRGTFNAIHLETSFKIDFFVTGVGPFDREEMGRAIEVSLADPNFTLMVKSPEDVVLRKLEWFRKGGEVSEQQWRDVLGVLSAIRDRVDLIYLDRWATELGVTDLLHRALEEIRHG